MKSSDHSSQISFVEIPFASLSAEALRGVIESFVLQEGTDYGHRDYDLDEKVARVMQQLERGKARVVFNSETETCSIQLV
ncbi:MAG: YheU family protein [Bdellovibrionales bacterium]|nr:YheU family protein [Bdellovibrionales bacterium]